YQQAQLAMGIFSPKTVSVGDLFMGALVPGLILVAVYMLYVSLVAFFRPDAAPPADREELMKELGHGEGLGLLLLKGLVPPIVLIIAVLGSILAGLATPTEASAVGAFGAFVLALAYRRLNLETLK